MPDTSGMGQPKTAAAGDPWYETFFKGLALELWRQAVPAKATAAEARAVARWLGLGPGARVLDVPCGNGRLALPLARRGLRVTGIDQSAEFIDEARAAAAGLAVDWIRADMRAIPADPPFDGALCLGNSFGYLDPKGSDAFAEAVGRALRPGGRFVLHTAMAAECVLPNLDRRLWHPVGDMLMLVEHAYDAAESRLDSAYTFVRAGRTETRDAVHWIHTVAEIRRMFARSGLETVAIHADRNGTPFAVGDDQLYLVFEKR